MRYKLVSLTTVHSLMPNVIAFTYRLIFGYFQLQLMFQKVTCDHVHKLGLVKCDARPWVMQARAHSLPHCPTLFPSSGKLWAFAVLCQLCRRIDRRSRTSGCGSPGLVTQACLGLMHWSKFKTYLLVSLVWRLPWDSSSHRKPSDIGSFAAVTYPLCSGCN